MYLSIKRSVIAAVLVAAVAGPVAAQDFSRSPNYGSRSLSAGFTPDPLIVNLQAGGDRAASNIASSCRGYISNAPDFRVQYTRGSFPLIISVASSSDTTLVVNGPDGRWYCDDDGGVNGLNPAIRFNNPQSGQYDIWVGTYSSGSLASASLHISEVSSQ